MFSLAITWSESFSADLPLDWIGLLGWGDKWSSVMGEGLRAFMSLLSIFLSQGDCLPDSEFIAVWLPGLPLLLFVLVESCETFC